MEASASSKIPIGYKFHPTDEELIHYLSCKANEEPLPCQGVVNDVFDLYSKEPSELFEGSEEKILYFFTKLKKKHEKGSRINRVTRIGNWKGQDKAKDIKDGGTGNAEGEERVIGMKRNFTYYVKSDPKKSGWSMTEYNLGGTNLKRAKIKDYVISQIKRQKQTEKEKEDAMEVAATGMQPPAEACNAIIEAIKPEVSVMRHKVTEPMVLQPEDCNDWLNDFAKTISPESRRNTREY
ncbi:NAC transcription factor NAM-2-like [Cornus florida]|uniref:NAC transcription factor NAM-2-like n=1 Tax=Cornus florida TaxID=4283 RepID=UPI00289D57CA|nr:NAC transcription factor NAM-2-like [Cornus florida]